MTGLSCDRAREGRHEGRGNRVPVRCVLYGMLWCNKRTLSVIKMSGRDGRVWFLYCLVSMNEIERYDAALRTHHTVCGIWHVTGDAATAKGGWCAEVGEPLTCSWLIHACRSGTATTTIGATCDAALTIVWGIALREAAKDRIPTAVSEAAVSEWR